MSRCARSYSRPLDRLYPRRSLGRCGQETLGWTADVVYVAVVSGIGDEHRAIGGGALALCEMTARRAEAKSVTETERELREVIEQSGDMLTRHDIDGRYLYVSPASVPAVGYRPEKLIGRHHRLARTAPSRASTRSHRTSTCT